MTYSRKELRRLLAGDTVRVSAVPDGGTHRVLRCSEEVAKKLYWAVPALLNDLDEAVRLLAARGFNADDEVDAFLARMKGAE